MARQDREESSVDVGTTGHEWDGIREFNNPLPRWWLWVLYATIVWAVGYWIAMPAWPLIASHTKGVLGYTERGRLIGDVAEAKSRQTAFLDRIRDASLESIRTDPQLLEFALAGGRSAFAVNCSQCHGSGGAGAKGFPNLNDDDWLWGGRLDDIHFTIVHGVRTEADPESRANDMPRFLVDGILNRAQLNDVVEYVLALGGGAADRNAAARGKAVFAEQCVACHGDDGRGNAELGAPNLADAIWLYGGDRESVFESTARGRRGVMPAWGRLLDPITVKQLTIYVHSLGGGR